MRLFCITVLLAFFTYIDSAFSGGCIKSFNSFLTIDENSSLSDFVSNKNCSMEEYEKDACTCYENESVAFRTVLLKDVNKMKAKKKKEFHKALNNEYRKKKWEEFRNKLRLISQKTLYLDQLLANKALPAHFVTKIPNCSFGGLAKKAKEIMPATCMSKFSKTMKEIFQIENVSNVTDLLKTLDSEVKDLVDFKKHRKNSCMPYRSFMDMQMLSEHLEESFLRRALVFTKPSNGEEGSANLMYKQLYEQFQRGGGKVDSEAQYEVYKNALVSMAHARNPIIQALYRKPHLRAKAIKYINETAQRGNCNGNTNTSSNNHFRGFARLSICKPQTSIYDEIYKDEELIGEILEDLNNDCSKILDGEAVSELFCNENPDIPFDELVELDSYKEGYTEDLAMDDPRPLLIARSCKLKGVFGMRKWTRKKPYSSPSTKLNEVYLDSASQFSDLTENTPPPNMAFERKTQYEQMDELSCKIFPECNGDNVSESCQNPRWLYMTFMEKFSQEFAPMQGNFDTEDKFALDTICEPGNDQIAKFGMLNNVSPEKVLSYCRMFRFYKVSAVNLLDIQSEQTGLYVSSAVVREINNRFHSEETTNSPISTLWGGGEQVGHSGGSMFTNYLTRSNEEDYVAVSSADPQTTTIPYAPRVSYGGDIPNPLPSNTSTQTSSTSAVAATDTYTAPIEQPSTEVSVNPSSSETTVSSNSRDNSTSNTDDGSDTYNQEPVNYNPTANTNTVSRSTPTRSAVDNSIYDEVVEIKPKEEVSSRSLEDKVEDARGSVVDRYSAEAEQLRKAHEERMADLRRRREDIRRQMDAAMDEREEILAGKELARIDERIREASNPRSLPYNSAYGDEQGPQRQFSSNSAAPNFSGESEDVKKGGASRGIASVKNATPEQQQRIAQTRALLQKNGIGVNSAIGRAIASVEDELSLSDLPSIVFDSKGKRRKFIATDFVYSEGLQEVIVSTKHAGNEEIGIIEYLPNDKRLVFLILRHPKSHKKNFKRQVAGLERKGDFDQIDKIVNEYEVKRVVAVPFNATENKLQAIGYTYREMFEKTISGYNFE